MVERAALTHVAFLNTAQEVEQEAAFGWRLRVPLEGQAFSKPMVALGALKVAAITVEEEAAVE